MPKTKGEVYKSPLLTKLGTEFAELEGGLEVPAIDAPWRKCSKQAEMAVACCHPEVPIHQSGMNTLKYLYKSGTMESDGFVIYKHCRGHHPDLFFRFISMKVVIVSCVGLTEEGQYRCKVTSALSGDLIMEHIISPKRTLALCKTEIHELMHRALLIIGQTVLEIQNFNGHAPNTKLKKVLQPPVDTEPKQKRLKF
jgi:hypothetical protein